MVSHKEFGPTQKKKENCSSVYEFACRLLFVMMHILLPLRREIQNIVLRSFEEKNSKEGRFSLQDIMRV